MFKIALTGKANSGKNTVANLFAKNLSQIQCAPSNTKCMALADPIKEMVLTMFPEANREYLFGSSALRSEIIPNAFKDGKPLTYRQSLIDIGTLGRLYRPSIWIDNLDDRFSKLSSDVDLTVITDVRYRNEFNHFKNKGFVSVRIIRDFDSGSKDSSETEQETIADKEFDFIIDNTKSLENLMQSVAQISEKLF